LSCTRRITIIGSYVKDLQIVTISAPNDCGAVIESIFRNTKEWNKDLMKSGAISYFIKLWKSFDERHIKSSNQGIMTTYRLPISKLEG